MECGQDGDHDAVAQVNDLSLLSNSFCCYNPHIGCSHYLYKRKEWSRPPAP